MVSLRDGVALAAVGWWLSPIITFLLNKLLSYLYDASEKLTEMRSRTITVKFTLGEAVEQRMLMELSERKPDSTKVKDLDALLRDLKNALYEAEEIFDLIDYYRIEKEVGNDSKTSWLQWCWQRIYDSTRERSAPLLQRVQQTLCWLWQSLRVAREKSAPLMQSGKQRLCGLWQSLHVAGQRSALLLQRAQPTLRWLWQWLRVAREKSALLLQLSLQGLSWSWRRCLPRSKELLPVTSTSSPSSEELLPVASTTLEPRSEELLRVTSTASAPRSEELLRVTSTASAPRSEELLCVTSTASVPRSEELLRVTSTASTPRSEELLPVTSTASTPRSEELVPALSTASTPRSEELLLVTSTTSASLVQMILLWCRSFDFKNFYSCIFNQLSKATKGARYYRDWSFDQFGFTSYQLGIGMESNCTIMGPLYIKLKKNMAKIEHLIVEARAIISSKKNLQETIAQSNQSRRSETGTYISNVTTGERQGLGLHSNAYQSHVVAANSRAAVTAATPPSVVFGLDKDCDKIVAMLHEREEDGQPGTNNAQCFSVIGIHGIAGSGKSTLVQLVCAREKKYRQEKKDGHFDLVMWIHVSENFSTDAIFKEMFEAATGTSCPHFNNLDTLQSNLEKELHGKQILLVLDDVWYSNRVVGDMTQYAKLQKILLPLNAGKTGSKILVTSRSKDALLALGAAEQRCIPISFLDADVFLNLFMHCALHGSPVDDPVGIELKKIGTQISKKLKGLPLAAKIVGGQLCIRKNVEFWKKVQDQNLWNQTMGALWWSYQLLDEEVRRCFAYCSVFPRRQLLERDELVKLWAAQGFAGRGNEGETIEDICRDYFDELVSASFLQFRAKERPDLRKDYYVVHDLLHDLAEKVTGNDCFRIENLQSPEVEVPPDARHVFLQTYDAAFITEKICKLESLRTLIIGKVDCVEENVLKSVFERLRKLRVLVMTYTRLNKKIMSDSSGFLPIIQVLVPASIGQLRHLRYLAFRSDGSSEDIRLVLPDTLSKLYHIQVLDFYFIEELMFSSWEGIFGLINLRHLIGPEDMKIPNIGRLTSLQSLEYFAATKEEGYELKQLGNLNKLSGELCITCLEEVESQQEALEAKLADKEGLRELELCWYDEVSPEVQTVVLEGLCPPTGLVSLTIDGYKGLRYPSWMVCEHNGGPKYLKYLTLNGWVAEPGPELRVFFTHLHTLTLSECSLRALPDFMEQLVSLQILAICGCMNIRSLPTLPQSLQVFRLYGCNEVFMSSCKRTGHPCWRKIRHIPSASIGGPLRGYDNFKMGVLQL